MGRDASASHVLLLARHGNMRKPLAAAASALYTCKIGGRGYSMQRLFLKDLRCADLLIPVVRSER